MSNQEYQVAAQSQPFSLHSRKSEGISCHVANKKIKNIISCGSLNGRIALVDIAKGQEYRVFQRAHQQCITDISFSTIQPHIMVTSSHDGSLHIYDCRLSDHSSLVDAIQVTPETEDANVLSVCIGGVQDYHIASTLNNTIPVYDIRKLSIGEHRQKGSGLQKYYKLLNSSHSDTISTVRFHPRCKTLLVSGADDNLVVTHDISLDFSELSLSQETTHEDDGDTNYIIATVNNDTPPRILSFIGQDSSTVTVISTTETLALWDFSIVFDSQSTSGFTDANTLKQFACRKLGRLPSYKSKNSKSSFDVESFSTYYLVNVFYDENTETVLVLGGISSKSIFFFLIYQFLRYLFWEYKLVHY
jgi:WD40 repeat protein